MKAIVLSSILALSVMASPVIAKSGNNGNGNGGCGVGQSTNGCGIGDWFKGEKGDSGADGKKGETGLTGAAGLNGVDGLNGKNGKDADMSAVNANSKSIKALEQSTNKRFASLQKQVDRNRDHASAGISGVAAMANIPQVSQGSAFSVGAGVGAYDGESALAVGVSARFNENVVTKASVAMTSESDAVLGAGVSYEW